MLALESPLILYAIARINFIFYKLWNFIFRRILRCVSCFYGSVSVLYPLAFALKFLAAWRYFVRKFYIIEIQLALEF